MVEFRWVVARKPLVGDDYQPIYQKLQYRSSTEVRYVDNRNSVTYELEWSDWKDVPIVWED